MSGTDNAVDVGLKEIRGIVGDMMDAKSDEQWKERKVELERGFDERLKNFETEIKSSFNKLQKEPAEGRQRFHPTNKDHPYVAQNWAQIQADRIKVAGRKDREVEAKGAGLLYARLVRANVIAWRKGHHDVRRVLNDWGDTWMVKDLDAQAEKVYGSVDKAAGADIFDTGAALIPQDYTGPFIEALRPAVVVRAAGAQEIDMPQGNVTFSRQTGTSTLQYAPESSNVRASGLRFDQIRMVSKELRGVVPISNALLENPSASADIRFRNDLTRRLAQREDEAFIRGDGKLNSPLGIRFRGTLDVASDASNANVHASSGNELADMVINLKRLLTVFAERNVTSTSFALLINPRNRINMQWVRGDEMDAMFPFRLEIQGGTIGGIPWFETTSVPANFAAPSGTDPNKVADDDPSGVGAGNTEMIMCAMDEFYIGDQTMAELSFFPGGAYHDGANVQSGISRGESVIAITARHDCNLTRAEYAHTLAGITY